MHLQGQVQPMKSTTKFRSYRLFNFIQDGEAANLENVACSPVPCQAETGKEIQSLWQGQTHRPLLHNRSWNQEISRRHPANARNLDLVCKPAQKRKGKWAITRGTDILTPSISLKLLTKKSRLSWNAFTMAATASPPAYPRPKAASPAFWEMLLAPDVDWNYNIAVEISFGCIVWNYDRIQMKKGQLLNTRRMDPISGPIIYGQGSGPPYIPK